MNKGAFSLAHRMGEGGRRPGEGGHWGWKEFAPDYVGPFRPETRVCEIENREMTTMRRMVFDQMQSGMKWNEPPDEVLRSHRRR